MTRAAYAAAAAASRPFCANAVGSARVDRRAAVDERAVAVEDREPVHRRFGLALRAARAPLAAPLAPPRLGRGGDLALLRFRARPAASLERQAVAGQRIEAERRQALGEMRRQLGRDVDLAAVGRVDPDPPRVEVKLAADPAGQERLRARHIWRRRRSDGRSPPCARAAGACGRSAAEARPRRRGCRRGRSPASGSSPEARAPR